MHPPLHENHDCDRPRRIIKDSFRLTTWGHRGGRQVVSCLKPVRGQHCNRVPTSLGTPKPKDVEPSLDHGVTDPVN